MRRKSGALAAALAAVVLAATLGAAEGRAAATCTPTGYVRDGIDLTAAVVDPAGPVTGTVDATGCNVGVYYGPGTHGIVVRAEIFGANYFGVVNDGARVTVTRSQIHDIGESPLNGSQHGVAVYFVYGSAATGSVTGNRIWNYQKGGVVVNGAGSRASIDGNTVTGQGPVGYIAQNGIQVGFGATGTVVGNTVSGNAYTGAGQTASGGIILVGGPGYGVPDYTANVLVASNTATGNDIGIWLSNVDAGGAAPTTPTTNRVVGNRVSDDAVTNTTGNGTTGYQAGIADQGDGDWIVNDTVCGVGYTPVAGDMPYLRFIDADASFTNDVHLVHNTTGTECSGPGRGGEHGGGDGHGGGPPYGHRDRGRQHVEPAGP